MSNATILKVHLPLFLQSYFNMWHAFLLRKYLRKEIKRCLVTIFEIFFIKDNEIIKIDKKICLISKIKSNF